MIDSIGNWVIGELDETEEDIYCFKNFTSSLLERSKDIILGLWTETENRLSASSEIIFMSMYLLHKNLLNIRHKFYLHINLLKNYIDYLMKFFFRSKT